MSKTAFLFPGQGSQTPGMASALAAQSPKAREILEQIDNTLGFKLSALMAEGPADGYSLPKMPSRPCLPALLRR